MTDTVFRGAISRIPVAIFFVFFLTTIAGATRGIPDTANRLTAISWSIIVMAACIWPRRTLLGT